MQVRLARRTLANSLPTTFLVATAPQSKTMNKSATQVLNEYQQPGITIRYEQYHCTGHSDHTPQWGCRVLVNGEIKGLANNKSSKKEAKEEAASKAITSLLPT